jgi:hypothetical protein
MANSMNGLLRFCLAGWAIAGLIVFANVPTAMAQWLPPWRAASPGEIERNLEAQGYELMAPLMRRPGVYLADVSAGPAGYQRLVVDAGSGQILERFMVSGRMWGPALARNEGFGEPQLGVGARPMSADFSEPPTVGAPAGKSAHDGSGKVHIQSAISPYGAVEEPAGTKPKSKFGATERKVPASKAPVANPPLPPPAPREAARPDGSGSPASRSWRKSLSQTRRRPTPVRPKSTTSHRRSRPRLKACPPMRVTGRR